MDSGDKTAATCDKIAVDLTSDFYEDEPSDVSQHIDANKKLLDVVTFYKNKITGFYQNKSWDRYKKLTNEYELIFTSPNATHNVSKYSPVSRSFFKLWEMLYDYKDTLLANCKTGPCNALFLAEGPGGFAEAFMKFRHDYFPDESKNDAYHGITLKSTHKTIPDWKYKDRCLSITYGKDGTGNLYSMENITHMATAVGGDRIDFITADGGFDFSSDFNNQEEMSLRLITCEVLSALLTQRTGGTFVVKVFDVFTPYSIQLIGILCRSYAKVTMIKPLTSRPANSEKYLMCTGFKGASRKTLDTLRSLVSTDWSLGITQDIMAIFGPEDDTPHHVTKNLVMFNTFYISRQVLYIQKTIEYIKRFSDRSDNTSIRRIIDAHVEKVKNWCCSYDIPV